MCPTAHAGRRRSDVPQGEGLPILFSPPRCANTARGGCDHPKSGSDTLCGDNTDLVEKVGGAEDGEDAHIKVSLDFSKAEEVTVCQFLEERKALYLEDFLFWKLLFCKHMDLFYINLKY